jgi:hypothetical protein
MCDYKLRLVHALSMELSLQMEHFAGGFTLCKKCHHFVPQCPQCRRCHPFKSGKPVRSALSDLTNTWQIDCVFVRFHSSLCALHKLPIFIGKSQLERLATPLGFEPRITPPKGAVLPLHHGVTRFEILDRRFSIQAQCPKFRGFGVTRSNSLAQSRLNQRRTGRV